MNGKTWLIFFTILILLFVGIVVYDNQVSIHWSVLKKEGLVPVNQSAPSIIPSIPYQFVNIIFLIVALIIIFGIFVGIYRSLD